MGRVALSLGLLTAFVVGSGIAAEPAPKPDSEASAPYLWRVVLHVRPHPLLDGAFRNRLRREIVAAIQPALGPLGTAEMIDLAEISVDRWEPIWAQFDKSGWPALETPRDLNGIKTHILHLEVRDGTYYLESRQLDGFTGLLSAAVRRQSTRAADLVGRMAGLMLDRDFGVCGTVEAVAGATDIVSVRFRGGALGPLDRFVAAGDVFAVAGLRRSARPPAPPPIRSATGRLVEAPKVDARPSYTATRREFTLLRALDGPKDGVARCKVLTGYPVALPLDRGIVGYRCMRLATVETPLALRVVSADRSVQRNSSAALVRANDIGFASPSGGDEMEFRDGVFRSPRPLGHLAFVLLSAGATRSAKVPVAVVGPEPIAIPFDLDPNVEPRARFERDCLDLARRVAETRTAQTSCFAALSRLISTRRNADALSRAKGGLEATTADDQELTEVLDRLRGLVNVSPVAGGLLAACDRQLGDVRKSQGELAARVKELEAIVARENDPVKAAKEVEAQELSTKIKVLLEQGAVEEALMAYDQLATLLPDNADVKARRDRLKADWATKGEEHIKAREFLQKTWPALATIPDLKDNLPALRSAVDACVKAGDRLMLRKLLMNLADVPVRLNDLITPLDPGNDADRKLLADAKELLEAIAKIEAEARTFLKGEKSEE